MNSIPMSQTTPRTSLKPSLIAFFEFVGQILSRVLEFKDFLLSNEEKELLASQGDEVAQDFFPQAESKWVKLFMFIMSLISVFGIRIYKYIEKENDKKPEKKAEKEKLNEIKKNNDFYQQNNVAFVVE